VITAAESGAGDADDGAEHHLPDSKDQGKNRKTPKGDHVMLQSSRQRD
jgi:hypothetical protein